MSTTPKPIPAEPTCTCECATHPAGGCACPCAVHRVPRQPGETPSDATRKLLTEIAREVERQIGEGSYTGRVSLSPEWLRTARRALGFEVTP